MRARVVVVGRGSPTWADEAVQDYAKRARRYGRIDEKRVRAETFRGDVDAVRTAEGERILGTVGARDKLVCLDERGEDLDTDGFVDLVKRCRNDGTHEIVFALGGPYGHDPRVRERAWRTIRLSSMVLNHEVARVVLYEQIYRSLSILHGGPYHH